MSDATVDPDAVPAATEAPADEGWAGAPLRSTLWFLAVPAAFAGGILVFGLQLPKVVLYGFGGIVGLVLFTRTLRDPEWVLATWVLYMPLARLFVMPIAPGLNGTNALMALTLLACLLHRRPAAEQALPPMPLARAARWWCGISLLSVVTAGFTVGFGAVIGGLAEDIKRWVDQFVMFFAVLHLIRDGKMARRMVVYMMIGGAVVLGLGVLEWLDKRWLDSIEKARLIGPQMQPNDFGAFLVYVSGPFIALLVTNLTKVRGWLVVPFMLVMAKMLLATFSRGAFIGVAIAGVMAGWVRGKAFLLGSGVLALGLLIAMPQLIPESLARRMDQTTVEGSEELDASSQTRIVLWRAAVAMTVESPLLGKGYRMFPYLKGRYTEMEVHESDNHNMYLYICSQMGVPALLIFLWLLYRTWRSGVSAYRTLDDGWGRGVGMGGAAMIAGLVGVNMFGSRMVDMNVHGYVWVYIAVLAHLSREVEARRAQATARGEAEAPP